MVVAILAIFLVTRMLAGPAQAPVVAPSVADASPAAAATESASAPSPSSSAPASGVAEAPASSRGDPAAAGASPGADDVAVVDAGTMTQQSRRGFVLTLIQQGVLTGVQALDTPPKVGVTALFRGLSPSLQRQFIAVVYAYINNGATGTQTLQLIDATSGSQVGSYSASDGLTFGQG